MPDLMGRDEVSARLLLNQLGLRNVQVTRDPGAVGAAGAIVSQSPVPNVPVKLTTPVMLRVVGGAGTP